MATTAMATALASAAGCTTVGHDADAGSTVGSQNGAFGLIRIERDAADLREADRQLALLLDGRRELEAALRDGDAALDGTDAVAAAQLPPVEGPRAKAVIGATFARFEGVQGRAVIDLVGGHATDLETCSLVGDEILTAEPDAEVALLDAGSIDVRVRDSETRLAARTFPDLGGLASGVFYAEDAELEAADADSDEYLIRGSGGDEILPFEVVVVAPRSFDELAVNGRTFTGMGALDRRDGLFVAWDAGDPHDRVEIEVSAAGAVLSCLAIDDGEMLVSAESLGVLGPADDARLTIRRVRQQPFDVNGVDSAWASVVVAASQVIELR